MRHRLAVLAVAVALGAIASPASAVLADPPAVPAPVAPSPAEKAAKEAQVRLDRLKERLRQYAKHRETLTSRCGECFGRGEIKNPVVHVGRILPSNVTCPSCEGTGVRVSATAISRLVLLFRSPRTAQIEGSLDTKEMTSLYQHDPRVLKTLKASNYELIDVVVPAPGLGRGVIRRMDGPDEEHRWVWVGGAGAIGGDWYFHDPRVDDVWPFPSLFVRAGKYPVDTSYDRFDDVTTVRVEHLATDQPDHRLAAAWAYFGKIPGAPPTVVRLSVTRIGSDWKYVSSRAVAALADDVRVPVGEASHAHEPLPKGEIRETVEFDVPVEGFLRMARAGRELALRIGTQELLIGEEERLALRELAVSFPKDAPPPK